MTFTQVVSLISLLGGLGGIAAALTVAWRLLLVFSAYLYIELTIDAASGRTVKLRTVVENKNSRARKIDGAFLLIGPAAENPGDTAGAILKYKNEHFNFTNLNEMVRYITNRIKRDGTPIQDDTGRMIIPLTYYFRENVDVAVERLSYEHILFCDQLPPGVYASRFYIETIPRLHRVVHAAFEIRKMPNPGLKD